MAVTALWSCNKTIPEGEDYGTPITISLGVGGDFSVSSDPATKAGADDGIYGINVYFDKERDGAANDIYAYGVFDNVESMTITLLSGYKYTFKCTMAKNGQEKLYYGQFGGNTYMGYAKPFQTSSVTSSQVKNAFTYTNNTGGEYLTGIGSGKATTELNGAANDNVVYPKLNRYYGELSNYSPITGGVVTIPLKRTCFGLKLILKGVPEGTLNASIVSSSDNVAFISKSTTSTDYVSDALNFSFGDVYNCWQNEINNPSSVTTKPAVLNWTFTSSKFSQWNLSGSSNITFKRNVLTTVTVSVTPDSASASISLTEEEWDDENTINMGINTDGLIDIIVNPEPED